MRPCLAAAWAALALSPLVGTDAVLRTYQVVVDRAPYSWNKTLDSVDSSRVGRFGDLVTGDDAGDDWLAVLNGTRFLPVTANGVTWLSLYAGVYDKISAGRCGDSGMAPIGDELTCQAAADFLGLGSADDAPRKTAEQARPEGCYWYAAQNTVWISTNPVTRGNPASSARQSICHSRGLTSTITPGTTGTRTTTAGSAGTGGDGITSGAPYAVSGSYNLSATSAASFAADADAEAAAAESVASAAEVAASAVSVALSVVPAGRRLQAVLSSPVTLEYTIAAPDAAAAAAAAAALGSKSAQSMSGLLSTALGAKVGSKYTVTVTGASPPIVSITTQAPTGTPGQIAVGKSGAMGAAEAAQAPPLGAGAVAGIAIAAAVVGGALAVTAGALLRKHRRERGPQRSVRRLEESRSASALPMAVVGMKSSIGSMSEPIHVRPKKRSKDSGTKAKQSAASPHGFSALVPPQFAGHVSFEDEATMAGAETELWRAGAAGAPPEKKRRNQQDAAAAAAASRIQSVYRGRKSRREVGQLVGAREQPPTVTTPLGSSWAMRGKKTEAAPTVKDFCNLDKE